ncbi:uncharacterized protein LOC131327647 [Rhododendron vialii]|uniref:uncharacterized protein LOC131327647 n=1 Tax=Rhododendron vialii TaxID=182163 RepID=UPI00265FD08B|nr:uncharacterized protein LOC131327647 [Rhododendron vialii]
MKPYHQQLDELLPNFQKVTFMHVPRMKNRFADALGTLASMLELPIGVKLRPVMIEQRGKRVYGHIMNIDESDDGLPWFYDIRNLVEKGEFPADSTRKDRIALQRLASQYIACGGQLYRRSPCGVHKLCIHGDDIRATDCIEYV